MPAKITRLDPGARRRRSGATRPATRLESRIFEARGVRLELGDAARLYARWEPPTVIVADGPYGVRGFKGDLPTTEGLAEWYAPHVAAWSEHALPETTLWFWGTEVGWAEVHPVLRLHGWEYRACHVWDKGVAHVAGNCNGLTIRRFPVVTEVCVQYVREVRLETESGARLPLKQWLRHEWQRAGLPLALTNEACGVRNAATRKYFTQCHLWYFPPPEMMERLARYAAQHGRPTDRPYFSLDGRTPLTAAQWSRMRAKWNHVHGVTNVWSEPALRNEERIRVAGRFLHTNQKPLRLIERIVRASSDPGDVVWEPFGGLCTTAVAALRTGRRCHAAEVAPAFFAAARERLQAEARRLEIDGAAGGQGAGMVEPSGIEPPTSSLRTRRSPN